MSEAAPGEFVEPAYTSRSLGEVFPAVGAALGHPGVAGPVPTGLVLPEAASYVVFLVDGLGAELLRAHAAVAPYLAGLLARSEPGTAGVPSTTSTSLTSLGTALPPGAHGITGFSQRVPGSDRLLIPLFWDKSVDPLEWQPHETTFDRLRRAGVDVTVVNKREFAGSGLTVAAQRGATYVGADRHGERIAAVVAAARAGSVVYMYDGDLDWTGHRYGVASSHWQQQLALIDAEAEQVRESLPAETRLVVVADHGMVDCGPEDRTDIDRHPELRDGIFLLAGEARFRHLHVRTGALDDVVATWREFFGDRAEVSTREDVIARGWFGPLEQQVVPRLGDVIVAARGAHGIFSSRDFGYETSLIGLHGSLTAAEMLIPMLVD